MKNFRLLSYLMSPERSCWAANVQHRNVIEANNRHTIEFFHVLVQVISGFSVSLPSNIQEAVDVGLRKVLAQCASNRRGIQ